MALGHSVSESESDIEACCEKTKALMPYAISESPAEHVRPSSLTRICSDFRHVLQYPLILLASNEGTDQPARCRKVHKGPFRALRIISYRILLHILVDRSEQTV